MLVLNMHIDRLGSLLVIVTISFFQICSLDGLNVAKGSYNSESSKVVLVHNTYYIIWNWKI